MLSGQGDISIEILAKLSQNAHIGDTHTSHIGITITVDHVVDTVVFENKISTSAHDRVEVRTLHLEER